ncbi:TonB-dependent receptor domain-containing protein [Vibrio quintilis]|uniref:Colicin I receptor n=1 Tax=Vibrio quintilis TaxID=1117707 RepID=A0A1M7YX79_9VIBR|nr:TonB-dependent receptor [Vibrio quintilis]SHO57192.1 Colicin I receptor precursor [Vibrio quintilis]
MKYLKLSYAVAIALLSHSVFAETPQETNPEDVMVVTATTNAVSIQEAPASVSVITNKELNRLPATDISAALENVAGVNISKSTGSEPKIIIRGLHNSNSANGNYTLLLINGRRISSGETVIRGAGFDLSSIPMSAIDHIEVVRGPMSSIYGSEALGGVVNVILKQPAEDTRVSGTLTYSKPGDNHASGVAPDADGELKNAKGFISGTLVPDTLLYTASLDVSNRDGWYPDDAGDNFSPLAEQKRTGLNTGLTWLASAQDKVLLDLGYTHDHRREIDTSASKWDNIYDSKKLTGNLGHQRQWNWGTTDISYFYEHAKVHENNSHPLVAETDMTQSNHTFNGKASLPVLSNQMLTTGFETAYTNIDNDRDYSDDRSVTQNAFYLQDELGITETLKLTLSGRYTHHNQFGSNFSPRAYMVFDATDNLTLKGGYGEGFKAPTIFQSSNDFSLISCGGRCYLIGNPDLDPQTSKTYEMTAFYHQDSWQVQVTGFFNKIEDMIDRDLENHVGSSSDGKYLIHYVNIDEVETKGFEYEGEFDLSEDFYLTTNATYTRAIDQSDKSEIAYTPRWLANANLHWYASENLSLFTGINYTGQQKDSDGNSLSAYAVFTLGASYQINDQWQIKSGITNLFDKRLDHTDQDYEETETGRTYYMMLSFDM